jgi:glycosyltransferase involved in cell wall biosynthesis
MEIVGGQSVQAHRLLDAFSGHPEVQLRLHAINPQLPLGLRRIPYVRTLASAPVYYAGLARGILASDVVHAFTSSFWGYTLWVIPAIAIARALGRPVIVNYRDGRAEHHLREWRSAVATLRHATIVVPSPYLVGVFGRVGLTAQVIPNAIDMSAWRRRDRQALRPVFLTNRGLEPLYNVDCTLRAFRAVQDRYPEARFVVANDGPLRGELEGLARQLQIRQITFTGAVSQRRMAELYDEADLYVMSPLIDNMPGTVLECFASGLPVVSTTAGGVPFVAEHGRNALLVPPGSHEELAHACLRLLEEPGLGARLAAEGHRDCVARYHADSVRDQWASLYRELVSAGPTQQ